jgi:cyclase
MLLPRIIPCLLFDENEDMVKTINFKHGSRRYIGDIENAVKIFSEKKADELIVIDIDASKKKEINYELIEKLVANCKMPLAYGGGIKNLEQAKKVFSLGVEKIILSSVIFENIYLINDISKYFGSQSVAVCLDIKINSRYLKLYSKNGTNEHKEIDFQSILNKIQELGAGELIINSVDRDGAMKGYDLEILKFFFS